MGKTGTAGTRVAESIRFVAITARESGSGVITSTWLPCLRTWRARSWLVDRARECGAVRPDITGTDVFLLTCAPVHVVGYLPDPPPDLWRRYLAIIFDGLRPEGASPLPLPGPDWP